MFKTIHYISFLFLLLSFFGCKEKSDFSIIKAKKSGLSFKNSIEDKVDLNILNFHYLYNGGGVGIADFNQDGFQDIFLGGNQVASKLYLGNGQMEFTDVTNQSGLSNEAWVNGICIIDINNDGFKDIYLSVGGTDCEANNCKNLLYINNADTLNLSFSEKAEEYGLDIGYYSQQAAFFDADLDGDLDVYIVQNHVDPTNKNYPKPKQYFSKKSHDIFLENQIANNDTLNYIDATEKWGLGIPGFGLGLTITDVNQDGYPDVYVANDFISDDLFLINQKGKRFLDESKQLLKHTSYNSMGVDMGDMNNDGLDEIMVVDMLPENNHRQKSMLGRTAYDKYQLSLKENYNSQFVRNTLQKHNGNTNDKIVPFSEIACATGLHQTDWSWAPVFFDIDNDTDLDLYITNGYPRDITNLDFVNYSSQPNAFESKDKVQEGILKKLKEQKQVRLHNPIFRNDNDFKFTKLSNIGDPSLSNGIAYGDLDNDGDLDWIVNNINSNASLVRNETQGRFLRIKLIGSQYNRDAIGAKVQLYFNDGTKAVRYNTTIRGYLSSVEDMIHFGLGEKEVDSIKIIWQEGTYSTITQPKTNQILEISYPAENKVQYPYQNKDNTWFSIIDTIRHFKKKALPHDYNFQSLLYRQISYPKHLLKSKKHKKKHWIIYSANGLNTEILLDKEGKVESFQILDDAKKFPFDASFEDVNLDGELDLIIAYGGFQQKIEKKHYENQIYLFREGKFQLDSKISLDNIGASTTIAARDFDKDGDLDIFIGNGNSPGKFPNIPKSYLYENVDGVFQDKTKEILGNHDLGMISDAIWTDINDDNSPDLMLVGEWMAPRIFMNDGERLIEWNHSTLDSLSGLWRCIHPFDYNNDGKTDYLLGNLGTNSRLQASAKQPISLVNDDLDGNGASDPILSCYLETSNNKIAEVPYHTRDEIMARLPKIKTAYNNYSTFGDATFPELLANFRSDVALLHVNCLESIVLITDSEGFSTIELPKEAQWSAINRFFSHDFNSDGTDDIAIMGNDLSLPNSNGRLDAFNGLVLQRNANGGFKVIPNQKSGVELSGESYGIVVLENNELLVASDKGLLSLTNFSKK